MQSIAALLDDNSYQLLLAIITIAGIVRGFSGFGTGMIVAPAAAALISPAAAIVIILIIDLGPASILIPSAAKKAALSEIMPMVAGYALGLVPGIWLLANGDVSALRWMISIVILVCVMLLWSGWTWRGPRTAPVSFGVGGIGGFLGGSISVAGPPVILYWMAARTGAGIVRSNLIIFFAIAQFFAAAGLYLSGLLTWERVLMGLVGSPFYLCGLMIGARLFSYAPEFAFRRIAFMMILAAAILSAPLWDGILR